MYITSVLGKKGGRGTLSSSEMFEKATSIEDFTRASEARRKEKLRKYEEEGEGDSDEEKKGSTKKQLGKVLGEEEVDDEGNRFNGK